MIKNRENQMGKKGDIPITILVIGVLVICLLALFSFYFSNMAVKKNFNSISLVEQAAVIKEKISFYRENAALMGLDEQERDTLFGIKSDAIGKYFVVQNEGISVRYNLGK